MKTLLTTRVRPLTAGLHLLPIALLATWLVMMSERKVIPHEQEAFRFLWWSAGTGLVLGLVIAFTVCAIVNNEVSRSAALPASETTVATAQAPRPIRFYPRATLWRVFLTMLSALLMGIIVATLCLPRAVPYELWLEGSTLDPELAGLTGYSRTPGFSITDTKVVGWGLFRTCSLLAAAAAVGVSGSMLFVAFPPGLPARATSSPPST